MSRKHPQASPFPNQQEMETFLARPLLSRLGTSNVDGSIHMAPLYYLYQDGEFLFGTQDLSRRVSNIKRDARVTILVDCNKPVLQSVMAYGKAVLDYEDVVAKRTRILERYYDSLQEARDFSERLARAWKTVIIRVRPTRVITVDYSQPFSIE